MKEGKYQNDLRCRECNVLLAQIEAFDGSRLRLRCSCFRDGDVLYFGIFEGNVSQSRQARRSERVRESSERAEFKLNSAFFVRFDVAY